MTTAPVRTRNATARAVAGLAAGLVCLSGAAAPLDSLLTALPERDAPQGYLEAGASRVNRSIDFSEPEDDPALAAQAAKGDYRDAYVSGGWRLLDSLWLSGSLARRTVNDGVDDYRYRSWQVSGQKRFTEAGDGWPAVAVRLSAWGNRASATETTTPVRVPGAILNSVKVDSPSDRQLQADLIGTWVPRPDLDVSAFVGAGRTRLSYGGLTGTTTRNGCDYDLQFNGNDIFGTLAEPCAVVGAVIEQFYDSSGDYGVDVAKEIAWRGSFLQTGVHLAWRRGPWTLHGGLLVHAARRDDVDDILAARGKPVHERNTVVTLQGDYRIDPRFSVFLRAQLSSHLFFNDMPVTYNTNTASSFGSRLSLFTAGLRVSF